MANNGELFVQPEQPKLCFLMSLRIIALLINATLCSHPPHCNLPLLGFLDTRAIKVIVVSNGGVPHVCCLVC